MSSDDIDLGQQAGFASDLSKSLAAINTRLNSFADASRTQAQFANQIAESFSKTSNNISNISKSSDSINQTLQNFAQNMQNVANNPNVTGFFDSFMHYMDEANERYKMTAESTEGLIEAAEKHQTTTQEAHKSLDKASKQDNKYASTQQKQTKDHLNNLKSINASANKFNKSQQKFIDIVEETAESIGKFVKAIKFVATLGHGLMKVIGSLIGAATTFVKTVLTLPFMVLKNVVKVGNALRRDLVETIGQAGQDSKEFFDSFSDIGQGITRMTNMGKGMLLEFELVNSQAVKLFGMGASGIATMIKETTSAIKAMGHYSEMFGSTITKNKDALFHFTRIKKAIGLEDEQLAYYAQDAGVSLISLNDRLTSMALQTELVSKEYGVDLKRLGKNFNKLRVDIALYGHLSDEELLRTTARLTQMKISVEDASNVFKKFNTFEDAANSVAMLSQTFGMNLDAMSIIRAENPAEIIDMFRDSMIATGRTFDEFNRFEKEILADQTGMTQEGLKALMTLRDQGLTHQEAVDAMKDQTPEAKQLKAIKSLTSSINMLQKVLTFNSPFEAFLKGLGKNSAATKEAREAFMSLSNTYQMIHDFAANIDGKTIDALMEPVIIIVDTMTEIFNSPAFKGGLTSLVEGFGELAMNLFGVTSSDKIYHHLKENLTGMNPKQEAELLENLKIIEKDIKGKGTSNVVKDLYVKYMEKSPKLTTTSAKFKAFLKDFKAKASKNPEIAKEYDEMMKNFHEGYTMSSFNKVVKTKKGIKKITSDFHKRVKSIVTGNTGNFEKFFDIAGATAGAIIKGAAILLTSGINLLNHVIDQIDLDQIGKKSGQKNIIEEFFEWDAGDLINMAEGIGEALGGLFSRGGKLAFFGTWLYEQLTSVLGTAVRFFFTIFSTIGREIFPNWFGKEKISAVINKQSYGEKGYSSKKDIGGNYVDASKFDSSDSKSQKSFAIKSQELLDKARPKSEEAKVIEGLRSRAAKNLTTKQDYAMLSQLEGAMSVKNDVGDLFSESNKSNIEAKKKEFEEIVREYYFGGKGKKGIRGIYDKILDANKIQFRLFNPTAEDKAQNLKNTFLYHIESVSDKLNDGDLKTDTSIYNKYFGKFLAGGGITVGDLWGPSLIGDFVNKQYVHDGTNDKRRRNDTNNWYRSDFFVDQFMMDDGAAYDTMALKQGGVIPTLMSDIATMSGNANNALADINSLYGPVNIETPYRLTATKVKEHKEQINKIKEEVKKPKQCEYNIPVTPELVKVLMPMFKEMGFISDVLMNTRVMAPDGARVAPDACINDTLSSGKAGMFPARDYDY